MIDPGLRCEAVLFDLDDTLLDHRGAAADALREWAVDLNMGLDREELAATWQLLEGRYYAQYQRGELTKVEQRRARIRALLHPMPVSDAEADEIFGAYWSRYRVAWRAFPDAEDVVRRALAAGFRVGLLTNGDAADQRRKVEATFLADLDLPLFASSELPGAKPDRSAFDFSCAALQVDPRRCLMVGDSYVNDIEGALGAGLSAVLLDRSDTQWELPARARLVRSLAELRFG